MENFERKYRRLMAGSGFVLAAFAAYSFVAWTFNAQTGVRAFGAYPLHYSISLCFLFCGLAFLSIVRAQPPLLTRACAAAPLTYGLFGLLRHFTVVSAIVTNDHTGMAPNTAACLVLSGAAIVMMTTQAANGMLRMLAHLGALILATALVFALGFFGGVTEAYRWFGIIPMSVSSASCFVLIALGIFSYVRLRELRAGVTGLGCLPVPALFGGVTLVAFLWIAFVGGERQRIEEMTQFRLRGLRQQVRAELRVHVAGLATLSRSQNDSKWLDAVPPEAELELFQTRYSAFRALGWAHRERPRWILHEVGIDLSTKGELGKALAALVEQAQERRVLVMKPLRTAAGRALLLVVAPHLTGGDIHEMALGLLDMRRIFRPVTQEDSFSDFSVVISQNESTYFESDPRAKGEVDWRYARASDFDLHGLTWRIEVCPSPSFLSRQKTALPAVIVFAGIVAIVLLGFVFRLSEAAYLRASQAESAYQQLKIESAERQTAERSLHEAQEQLRQSQKMEAVGRLAGGIAHDFNSFLTAITGFAEIGLAKLKDNAIVRTYLVEIKKAGEEAATVTQQLLAFSRKQVLEPKILDLNALVKNLETLFRHLLGSGIELELHLHPGLGSVRGDRGQLEQVVMNLVVNARDAIGSHGRIVIDTDHEMLDSSRIFGDGAQDKVIPGDYVRITLRDTGCGMTDRVKSHLFEPFFTTKEVGKGTGMGLAMVFGIVKQSEGYILVESSPEAGTAIIIYLPRAEGVEIVPPVRTDSVELLPELVEKPTVLVVEDNESVRKLTAEALRMYGYLVIEAENEDAALAIVLRSEVQLDLLLTDLVMSNMGGAELAERVRDLRPGIPVVFMTGYIGSVRVRNGEIVLRKPFSPQELARTIADVLRAHSKAA